MTPETVELTELRVLRGFKERLPRADLGENVSPFDNRVTTSNDAVGALDLPDIHRPVRERIERIIQDVHTRQKSQVILLSGERGTGKTHLLQSYRAREQADALGYVFVGGSNHWAIEEFEGRLLDWVVEALTAPSPSGEHLLLDRVRAIGFRAVDQFLDGAAWRQFVSRPKAGWLGRRWLSLRRRVGFTPGPSHDRLEALAEARDPALFSLLDFAKFSEYVCDRFLADKSNVGQRYALRVLLTYLFPPEADTGVGYRERVLHWFRRRPDDGYFASRLGVEEALDRRFAQFDAVKLLVHLFSPAVSRELATEKHPCAARVFLVTFDQVEGRNELFSADSDWRDFFAQLSELYHALPNVVVIFTMTLGLRGRLQPMMERQFRDRIRMDDNFLLQFPSQEQILELYQSRIRCWICDNNECLQEYQTVRNLYLPLSREYITDNLKEVGPASLRDVLENFDRAFRTALARTIAIEPRLDFLVAFNEEFKQYHDGRELAIRSTNYDFSYTESHLRTLNHLLRAVGSTLASVYSLSIETVELNEELDPPVLRLEVHDQNQPGTGVWYHIALLGYMIAAPIEKAIVNTIRGKEKLRQFLWAPRPATYTYDVPEPYTQRVRCLDFPAELESRLRALLVLVQHRAMYESRKEWAQALEVLHRELGSAYIGDLLKDARQRLDTLLNRLVAGNGSVESDEPAIPAPSTD